MLTDYSDLFGNKKKKEEHSSVNTFDIFILICHQAQSQKCTHFDPNVSFGVELFSSVVLF